MRIGIKGKQVLGVTAIVGLVVVALSLIDLARLARVSLNESQANAELLANAVYHRARDLVTTVTDPRAALRSDPGLRSILESSLYSKNVTFASIVDADGVAVVHTDPALEGQQVPAADDFRALIARAPLAQLLAIYADEGGRNFNFEQPLLLGNTKFGSIRIGISTLLIRHDLDASLEPAIAAALLFIAISVFGAMLLAQLILRPIHVIRSGLTRLGQGEFGVRLDLNQQDEFGELGSFFNTVSAQLSANRSQMAGQVANLESAVEHLEDAVAMVNANGELLFENAAMRALLPQAGGGAKLHDLIPAEHQLRQMFAETLATRQQRGPVSARFDVGERLILAHPVNDASGDLVGVMLIVRNLEYLTQVQSTIRYSRKLAALGRLSAGVAHEVKNPLNAMMIHLELLRQKFNSAPVRIARIETADRHAAVATVASNAPPRVDVQDALEHVDVIAEEIRRLDEVVQGFLKFSRPEDLKLQPVRLSALFDEVIPIVRPEAEQHAVQLVVDCADAPDVNGDPAMLRQAFLNLALNACQAMPNGGTLRIQCEVARGRRVAVTVADTGIGINPEHLQRIFDLYFTTRPKGSGIGLSMVYRTVQMHDGEIEVQSTPGAGTTFRILLPQA